MPRGAAGFLLAVFLSLLAAGCGGGSPPPPPAHQYEPLHYEYLTKIRLDVAGIDIDDNWAPRGEARHVEYLSPVQPLDALRQMANDRLVAGGNANRARFRIEDASIVRLSNRYQATLAVRLDILNDDGNRLRGIVARVTDVHPVTDESAAGVRNDLYALTRQAMDDMNVEFEYQIRAHLNAQMEPTTPTAPPPPAVGTEDLGPPGSSPPPAGQAPAPSDQGPGLAAPAPTDQGGGLPPPTQLAPTPLAPPPPAATQPPADQLPNGEPPSDQPPSDQPPPD
jgi:hypothetical protein